MIAATTVLGSVTAVSHAEAAKPAVTSNAMHKVIVLLKDQPASVSKQSPAFASRRSRILAAQATITKQLRSTSKNVKPYQLINAVAATVSGTEQAKLQADPSVATVIPDEVIHGPAATDTTPAAAALAAAGTTVPPTPRTPPPGACPAKPPLPEALSVTHTASADTTLKTARTLGYTGKGVKVAYMAEGIDTDNPDFIRADGSKVFVDYQDFSTDGSAAPTSGDEAFLDASAIAAQGLHTYDIRNFSAVPLSRACSIRIEGMAPGASLVGLKVFSENNVSTTSGFLQAIDYAVNVAKVDVLNESFGANPFPDQVTADAVAMFDKAAVAAGVTVTVSTGDAGPTNTIGSPASEPSVISVGGSTTFRAYAQTGYGGYYPLAKGGWLNDNISPLSSSGFTQSGRTLDLVAPGDIDFAVCTANPALYSCANFAGKPSAVEESGGTSESAPLTAGAAALVIEAYRHAHSGANPTPALVKKLLVSTADDLGHPAEEQGAGRLNSYQAVLAALSVHDANGTPAYTGQTLLTSKTQVDAVALPGTTATSAVNLTNNGSVAETVKLSRRTLGPAKTVVTRSVTLSNTTSNHFTDYAGVKTNYVVAKFTLPLGRNRLDVDYVYPTKVLTQDVSLSGRVRLALIDPAGRFAAHSLPQGVGNAGHVDVRNPAHGTWTLMIWSRTTSAGGTVGTVRYRVSTHNFVSSGKVAPTSVKLAPGETKKITTSGKTTASPGDRADALLIKPSVGRPTSLPIALRSLIDVAHGGHYSGVLTGGNGREFGLGQTGYFQFDVPAGKKDLTANFHLSAGATDPAYGYLVDPDGNAQAYSSNVEFTGFDSSGNATGKPQSALSMFQRAPIPGRWTLILSFAPAVTGTTLSRPFTGTITTDTVNVKATGLPNSAATTLPAGVPVTVPVTIKNTGLAPESFFVDPRLTTSSDKLLAPYSDGSYPLPLSPTGAEPLWTVPTETSKVTVGVSASLPVSFDFGLVFGDPDIAGTSQGTTATGSYSGNPVPAGTWYALPSEIGPYGTGPAPKGTADVSMTATTLDFDPAVTSTIGNYEETAVNLDAPFQGVINVPAGQSITIPVTIKPTGTAGTVVSGNLFVDKITVITVAGVLPSGQELTALPYTYKIG